MQSYNHFTLEKRGSLSEKLKEGKTLWEIAKEINKNVSSINREIKRNKNKDGIYNPFLATISYIHRWKICIRQPFIIARY